MCVCVHIEFHALDFAVHIDLLATTIKMTTNKIKVSYKNAVLEQQVSSLEHVTLTYIHVSDDMCELSCL